MPPEVNRIVLESPDGDPKVVSIQGKIFYPAGWGQRFVGRACDEAIGLALFIFGVLLQILGGPSGGALALIMILPAAMYILLADGFSSGQSLGKRVARTAVIDETTGEPCTYRQSFSRNVTMLFIIWIELLFVVSNRGMKEQRIGDILAGTIVVDRNMNIKHPGEK